MMNSLQPRPPLPGRDVEDVLDATASLWESMRDSRLFVTGGTGFIGTWLLETWLAANRRFSLNSSAVVLTRDPEAFAAKAPHVASHPRITLVTGDVRSFEPPSGEVRFVIHGATEASANLSETRPLEMLDTILSGTRRVLDFSVSAGTERLLFLSSGAVYGRQSPETTHVEEDSACAPDPANFRSAYAEGKRAAETMCAIYAHEHPSLAPLIARCFAFVGPHLPLDRHFAIGNFIGDVLNGQPVRVHGDGTAMRSYLYASDLAIWLWTILFSGMPLRPYNVGSETGVSILEIAKAAAAAVKDSPAVIVSGTPDPSRPPERYIPSTARARRELGLDQTVDLASAIDRTIAWYGRSVPVR